MTAIPACPAGCSAPSRLAFVVGTFDAFRCDDCGVYLLSGAHDGQDMALDRTQFDDAFRALRSSNYRRILDAVAQQVSLPQARLLDIGCSSGWFLESAAERGCQCCGIEPDSYFYRRARESLPPSVQVVEGYFPRDLPAQWGPFDVITFHDVFEHLEDPVGILEACRERLTDRGVVILSLPSADGFVYRLGLLLHGLGWKAPLERMFQVHYPFPHLFYFTPASVERLAERVGFKVVASGRVDAFAVRGSLHRAKLDESSNAIAVAAQYAKALGLVAFALVQKALPTDNAYFILRPRSA
jgi:SAM-dependent methyltransferase